MESINSFPTAIAARGSKTETTHVHVVDDDLSVGRALARLLGTVFDDVTAFPSAESFLAGHDPDVHGCIILDVSMPGTNGLALQQALIERSNHMPVIFLTGNADVPMCAQAMKHGAVDFLTKPVDESALLEAVTRALKRDAASRQIRAAREASVSLMATLTPREREVLTHVSAGRLNKQIAADLGTAEKTIKVHRSRGLEKMHVRSVADLVRAFERALREESAGRD